MAQRSKCLPAMRETRVWFLGREDPLEKEMATHSSILAWRIPWTEEPGRLQSTGLQRVRRDWATSLSKIQRNAFCLNIHYVCIIECTSQAYFFSFIFISWRPRFQKWYRLKNKMGERENKNTINIQNKSTCKFINLLQLEWEYIKVTSLELRLVIVTMVSPL